MFDSMRMMTFLVCYNVTGGEGDDDGDGDGGGDGDDVMCVYEWAA